MQGKKGSAKRLKASACPACRKRMDAATALFGEFAPKAGDVSVCFYCGAQLVFNSDMTLRLLTKRDGVDDATQRQLTALSKRIVMLRDSEKGHVQS